MILLYKDGCKFLRIHPFIHESNLHTSVQTRRWSQEKRPCAQGLVQANVGWAITHPLVIVKAIHGPWSYQRRSKLAEYNILIWKSLSFLMNISSIWCKFRKVLEILKFIKNKKCFFFKFPYTRSKVETKTILIRLIRRFHVSHDFFRLGFTRVAW